MDPLSHRRQVLLFFVAVILPSIVLVVLSLRMISQENELAENREIERRESLARELGQQFLERLERIKQDVANAQDGELDALPQFSDHPALAMVGRVESSRLVLPWDVVERSHRQVEKTVYHRKLQDGEVAEWIRKQPREASRLYEAALTEAQTPTQSAVARLSLARSLVKAGRMEQADLHFRTLLQLSPGIRDEYSVPMSFYGASRLLDSEGAEAEILHSFQNSLTSSLWLSPTASKMLAQLTETLADAIRGGSFWSQRAIFRL